MSCCSERKDPVYFSISIPVHASGWITDPKIYVLFETPTTKSLTLVYAIADLNGNIISDTATATIPTGTRVYTKELGDFIDAQRIARNIPVGIYTLLFSVRDGATIIDTFATTIFLCNITLSITPTPEIRDILVIDKYTGVTIRFTQYAPIPQDPRFTAFVYYYKDGLGRIEIYENGLSVYDSGYRKLVQLQFTKMFTSIDQMFDYVFSNSYMPIYVAREFLREATTRPKKELIKPLMTYYVARLSSFGFIGATADVDNLMIIEESLMFFGEMDWGKIFDQLVWGLAIAGCIAGAGIITAKTGGLALPVATLLVKGCLSGGFIGAGLGIGINIVKSYFEPGQPTPPQPPPLPPTIPEYQEKFEENARSLEDLLTQWRNQNKITQQEYEQAMVHLNNMKTLYNMTVKDLETWGQKNYQIGYQAGYDAGLKEGKKDAWKYGLIGGGAGLVIGVLIGRR